MTSTLLPWRTTDEGRASLLAARVMADLDPMVGRMGVAYRAEIAEYAALTPE